MDSGSRPVRTKGTGGSLTVFAPLEKSSSDCSDSCWLGAFDRKVPATHVRVHLKGQHAQQRALLNPVLVYLVTSWVR